MANSPNRMVQDLLLLKTLHRVQGLHWVGHAFRKAGSYDWETRRNGEVKLGYWRKTLRARDQRSPYPKRFILIPGWGDSPLSWHGVITLLLPILKLHYDELILFDFPGFGGLLSRERTFPSMDLMMSFLSDVLDSLKPHTILGHSLGGWLTAHYASLCGSGSRPISNRLNYAGPELILLANPSGVFFDLKTRQAWEALFKEAIKEGFSVLRPHLFAQEPVWFRWLAPRFSRFLIREDTLQFMASFREDHCVDQAASHIQSAVWLLWGEKDTLIPPSCASAWLKHLNPANQENHQAVFLRGVGHSPHLEKPAITAGVVAQILSKRALHPLGKRWWTVLKNESEIVR